MEFSPPPFGPEALIEPPPRKPSPGRLKDSMKSFRSPADTDRQLREQVVADLPEHGVLLLLGIGGTAGRPQGKVLAGEHLGQASGTGIIGDVLAEIVFRVAVEVAREPLQWRW